MKIGYIQHGLLELSGYSSNGVLDGTPLDQYNSLSGCSSNGVHDGTPLDKLNSLSGCLSKYRPESPFGTILFVLNGLSGHEEMDRSTFGQKRCPNDTKLIKSDKVSGCCI